MKNKEEMIKCLESLKVNKDCVDKFIESLQIVHEQMIEGETRASHPSLLKICRLIQETLGNLQNSGSKILTCSTYSSSNKQIFDDLNEALATQIEKARQTLNG